MQNFAKLPAGALIVAAIAAPASAATIQYDIPDQGIFEVDCSKLDYIHPETNFRYIKENLTLWQTHPDAAQGVMDACDAAEHPQVLAAQTTPQPSVTPQPSAKPAVTHLPKVGPDTLVSLILAGLTAATLASFGALLKLR